MTVKFKAMRNEGDVKENIKRLLKAHDWFYWMPPANAFGRSGISDIHAVSRGMFMIIEAKFGDNPPTGLQIGFLNSVQQEQHFAFVVSDSSLPFFAQFLEMLDQSIVAQSKQLDVPQDVGSAMVNAIKVLTDPIPLT